MKFTKEMLEKAKTAKNAEELAEMAKAENIELNAEAAAKAFDELNKTGELADDELDNVAGGCDDPTPNAKWGEPGVWKERKNVQHEFEIGTRVVVYLTPSTTAKGTINAMDSEMDDWGWYPIYRIHFDEGDNLDRWYAQAHVGKLL